MDRSDTCWNQVKGLKNKCGGQDSHVVQHEFSAEVLLSAWRGGGREGRGGGGAGGAVRRQAPPARQAIYKRAQTHVA